MDYNIYNSRMNRAIDQKLFFIDLIKFDRLIDIGCADGSLIFELANMYPKKHFIGYDIDNKMLDLAREKCVMCNNVEFTNTLEDKPYNNEFVKTAMLFSSVLHEMLTFHNIKYVEKLIKSIQPKYVCVRDMYETTLSSRYIEDKIDLFASRREDDISIYIEMENPIEYMLKHKYINGHNRERELSENYFAFSDNEIAFDKLFKDCVYRKDYCPQYFKDMFSQLLHCNWDIITHTERIYKYVEEKE